MFKIPHYPNYKMSMFPKIFQFSNVATHANLLEYQTGHIGASTVCLYFYLLGCHNEHVQYILSSYWE